MADTKPDSSILGSIGGQPVDLILVKLKGVMVVPRELKEGDTLTIVATGDVTLPRYKRVKGGVLVAEHDLVCEIVGETVDHLAEEASSFLKLMEDQSRAARESMEGQQAFDPTTGELLYPDEDGDGDD